MTLHGSAMGDGFRLDGRSALVIGAGRGIGRACALAFAAAGANLVLASRTASELEEVAAAADECGVQVSWMRCDATSESAIESLFTSADDLDVLVHCAGINRPAPIAEMHVDDLDAMLALNIRSAYLAARAATRKMTAQGRGGSIIFISSQMGHVGAAQRTAYCATKHAIEGLSKAMAVELGPVGIRVNTIAPTFVETAMTAPFFADTDFRRDVVSRIPIGRLGSVEEVAAAALFAACPAAALVTGTSIVVDGGWTAQ